MTSSNRAAVTLGTNRRRRGADWAGFAAVAGVPATCGTAGSATTSCDTAGSSGSGDLDLFAQRVPDPPVHLEKGLLQPDLLDEPGTGELDRDDVLDRRRGGGHDDDRVGQRDGLRQVV